MSSNSKQNITAQLWKTRHGREIGPDGYVLWYFVRSNCTADAEMLHLPHPRSQVCKTTIRIHVSKREGSIIQSLCSVSFSSSDPIAFGRPSTIQHRAVAAHFMAQLCRARRMRPDIRQTTSLHAQTYPTCRNGGLCKTSMHGDGAHFERTCFTNEPPGVLS